MKIIGLGYRPLYSLKSYQVMYEICILWIEMHFAPAYFIKGKLWVGVCLEKGAHYQVAS